MRKLLVAVLVAVFAVAVGATLIDSPATRIETAQDCASPLEPDDTNNCRQPGDHEIARNPEPRREQTTTSGTTSARFSTTTTSVDPTQSLSTNHPIETDSGDLTQSADEPKSAPDRGETTTDPRGGHQGNSAEPPMNVPATSGTGRTGFPYTLLFDSVTLRAGHSDRPGLLDAEGMLVHIDEETPVQIVAGPSNVCYIQDGTVFGHSAGTCTIVAEAQSSNGVDQVSNIVTAEIIGKRRQTIRFYVDGTEFTFGTVLTIGGHHNFVTAEASEPEDAPITLTMEGLCPFNGHEVLYPYEGGYCHLVATTPETAEVYAGTATLYFAIQEDMHPLDVTYPPLTFSPTPAP